MFLCGPSRLVWFAFGSVATWAWLRHHHEHRQGGIGGGGACPRHVGYGHRGHGYDHRGAQQWEHEREGQSSSPNNNNNNNTSPPAGERGDYGQWRPTTQQVQPATQSQQKTQFESMTPTPTQMDIDRERLRQISRSAEETISGMSETTIDSMMNGLQRLKDRLAERRGQQQWEEIGPQQANPSPPTSPKEPSGPRHSV